jgi:uncharacterized protein (TIGR03118 family)
MQNFIGIRFASGVLAATAALFSLGSSAAAQTAGAYTVTNIISDGSVPAATMDPNFINPWAISVSGNMWISANGSGYNYVVPPTTGQIAFKVIVPAPNGTSNGTPTGSSFTTGSSATSYVLPNGTKASFLFSTDSGTISGWNGKLGTANALSQIAVNNSAANASYTGLAILNTATTSYLLAPNFGAASAVEVYDSNFKLTKLTGSFTDPNLPAGYAPYSIHILNGQIFVTFAVHAQTGGGYGTAGSYNEVVAPGNGLVDVFDLNGNFVARAITGGNLNEPWGVAFAPATFGIYANDLLVGNFGDGIINVYDPKTYSYIGQMMDGTGKTLVYPSLWEIIAAGTPILNSTSVSGGTAGTVYFTSGLVNQAHGLLAGIANDSTTAGSPNFGVSASNSNLTVAAGSSVSTMISVAPTYNFSGSLALSCNNLPVGVTCAFTSPTLAVTGSTPALTQVTISTTKSTAQLEGLSPTKGIAFALGLPLLSLGLFGRRAGLRKSLRLTLVALCGITLASLAMGCSTNAAAPIPGTPAGAQTLNVQMNSGTISKVVPINFTVK